MAGPGGPPVRPSLRNCVHRLCCRTGPAHAYSHSLLSIAVFSKCLMNKRENGLFARLCRAILPITGKISGCEENSAVTAMRSSAMADRRRCKKCRRLEVSPPNPCSWTRPIGLERFVLQGFGLCLVHIIISQPGREINRPVTHMPACQKASQFRPRSLHLLIAAPGDIFFLHFMPILPCKTAALLLH